MIFLKQAFRRGESSILEKCNFSVIGKLSLRRDETHIFRKASFLPLDAILENLHFVGARRSIQRPTELFEVLHTTRGAVGKGLYFLLLLISYCLSRFAR